MGFCDLIIMTDVVSGPHQQYPMGCHRLAGEMAGETAGTEGSEGKEEKGRQCPKEQH